MTFREIGKCFCNEINLTLQNNQIEAAFVTGGGYAYDSIKYDKDNNQGDFDFMIIYNSKHDIDNILKILNTTEFNYEDKYIKLDQQLLSMDKIDIIRLSGKYKDIKSTINLVPKKLIERVCNFEKEIIIKKVAHNRNTSLFYAYGSNCSRIPVNFIAPSFITNDGEDHYIHLDFSQIEQEKNIYLGILSDAILKGFNYNYDTIGFYNLRKQFIKNIHQFFFKNNINSNNFIYLFSNHNYFPEYLKKQLIAEFNQYGIIDGKEKEAKKQIPIVLSIDFDINYEQKPFNFIHNKKYKTNFKNYILEMQNNEYNRQYLIDSLGKFCGYLLTSKHSNNEYTEKSIIDKILVYGVNDLFLPQAEQYSISSILKCIMNDLNSNSFEYNNELLNDFLIICSKFLNQITEVDIKNIMEINHIDTSILNPTLDQTTMQIEVIRNLNSFEEIGTYHNYTSKVMHSYSQQEAKFLSQQIPDKNSKILDVMCGYGRLANELKFLGYENISGIDISDYSFLGVSKDFVFIKDNFIEHHFQENYDFLYSLYNCYQDNEQLEKNIIKLYSILNSNGIAVIDCFNKTWRDSVDKNFYKELYVDEKYKLVIKRDYDKNVSKEKTIYELYYQKQKIKEYVFIQKFFEINEIIEILANNWDFTIINSTDSKTRNNSQKHIMVLRKK